MKTLLDDEIPADEGSPANEVNFKALASILNNPLERGPCGFWIEYPRHPDQYGGATRRLVLAPIVADLWLRRPHQTTANADPLKALDARLRQGPVKRLTLVRLLKAVNLELELILPVFLIDYCKGQLLHHPLRRDRWLCLQGTTGESLEADTGLPSPADRFNDGALRQQDPLQPYLEAVDTPGLTALRQATRVHWTGRKRLEARREALTNLQPYLDQPFDPLQPDIIRVMTRWLHALYQSNLAPSTIQWMVSLTVTRIVSAVGEERLEEYTEEQLEGLYLDLLESAQSPSHRDGIAYGLRSLHAHLGKRPLPILSGGQDKTVSALVISHEEYRQCQQELALPTPTMSDPDWCRAAQLLLMLLFRLGLRRQEAYRLQLRDIRGIRIMDLLIRDNDLRPLKTRNAKRMLPLHLLCSAQELEMLRHWIERLRAAGATPETHLFATPANPSASFAESTLVDRLVDVMRATCHDPVLHLHHLRHSFATWTTHALLPPALGDDLSYWQPLPATRAWMQDLPNRVATLFGREPPQQKMLFLVAQWMGHSTPGITLEHYIHELDPLISNQIWRTVGVEVKTLGAAGLGMTQRTFERHAHDGWEGILRYRHQHARDRVIDRCTRADHSASPGAVPAAAAAARPSSLFDQLKWVWRLAEAVRVQSRDEVAISDLCSEIPVEEMKRYLARMAHLQEIKRSNAPIPPYPRAKSGEAALRAVCKQLDGLAPDLRLATLRELASIWVANGHHHYACLRFKQPDEVVRFLNCLQRIGVSREEIACQGVISSIDRHQWEHYRAHWNRTLKSHRLFRPVQDYRDLGNDRPLGATHGYLDVTVRLGDSTGQDRYSPGSLIWLARMAYVVFGAEEADQEGRGVIRAEE